MHEFGILPDAPESGARYDRYVPCHDSVSVDDDAFAAILHRFDHMDFYWHTTAVKEKGINYCGITLIPPSSMQAFAEVLRGNPAFYALYELACTAQTANKWLIHFGI